MPGDPAPDTQSIAGFSLAPWTRDVGQMVVSPGDLARIVGGQSSRCTDGLVRFGDATTASTCRYQRLAWPDFGDDLFSTARAAADLTECAALPRMEHSSQ
jgi:hypothetical protein